MTTCFISNQINLVCCDLSIPQSLLLYNCDIFVDNWIYAIYTITCQIVSIIDFLFFFLCVWIPEGRLTKRYQVSVEKTERSGRFRDIEQLLASTDIQQGYQRVRLELDFTNFEHSQASNRILRQVIKNSSHVWEDFQIGNLGWHMTCIRIYSISRSWNNHSQQCREDKWVP